MISLQLLSTRLELRYFLETDKEDLYEYASYPAVGNAAGWCVHTSIEDGLKEFNHFIEKKELAIVYRKKNKVIGSVGIMTPTLPGVQDGIELAFALHPDYWGKGLMTETLYLLLPVLLKKHHVIYAWHLTSNFQLEDVLRGVGFQYLKDYLYELPKLNKSEVARYYRIEPFQFIKIRAGFSSKEYHEMRRKVGWKNLTDQQVKTLILHSTYKVACYKGPQVIGMARVISDQSHLYLLADVMIDPNHQHQGIGKRLVKYLLNLIEDEVGPNNARLYIMSLKGKEPFYQSLGFQTEDITGLYILKNEGYV